MEFTDDEFYVAGLELGNAMRHLAAGTVGRTGVYWKAVEDAPNTYEALLAIKDAWVGAYDMLPVWNGASENSIYGSELANYSFRYWHDMGHIEHQCDFTPAGEFRLQAMHHLPIIARHFGTDSLEYAMYYADTVGQIEYNQFYKAFPSDQAAFVADYVRGLP